MPGDAAATAALRAQLEDERALTVRLQKQLRVSKEREAKGDTQGKIDKLTQELDVQGLEMQRTTVSAVQTMGKMASDTAKSMSAGQEAPAAAVDAEKAAFSEASMWPWQMMQQMREQMQQSVDAATQSAEDSAADKSASKRKK